MSDLSDILASERIRGVLGAGLGSTVCVFYGFGGPGAPEATIVIGVSEARCAYFACLETLERRKPCISRVWRSLAELNALISRVRGP